MKKRTWIILIIILATSLTFWSCRGLITMFFYGQMIKPTETWYFSRGFDKKLDQSLIKTQIADSCNISNRAIRLIRKDKKTIKNYWIDFDTTYRHDNQVRIKIVDFNGFILRFLDAWLVPDLINDIDYSLLELVQDKKGNIVVKSNSLEHRIYHAGDMMGMHHFDILKPKKINSKASFQLIWNGYNFNYSWMTYEGIREDFHLINQYSYEGQLVDSFFVTIKPMDFKIVDNYFIQYKDWDSKNRFFIINNGQEYFFTIDNKPLGGFGEDRKINCVNPILHSFSPNGYIDNCFKNISFERTISEFDWLRNNKTLRIVNETIKTFGYSKFISKSEFYEKKYAIRGKYFVNYDLGYSLNDISDSLVFYYQDKSAPIYYKEFWERRKSENIDKLVYVILTEIKNHYSDKSIQFDNLAVNDTLKNLLNYDLQIQSEDKKVKATIILDYYRYLTNIGLSQSAYNLIFLDSVTEKLDIDKNKIFNELTINKQSYRIDNKTYFLTTEKPKWIDYE